MTDHLGNLAEWAADRKEALALIADLRPVCIRPLAPYMSAKKFKALESAVNSWDVMRCPKTSRLFVPKLCLRA